MKRERPDAVLAFGYPSSSLHRRQIVEFVAKNRLAAIYPNSRWIDAGGLMSYSVDHIDNARQKAIYVDKIINGARPAELPVQRPRKYTLVINLKTATAMGLTIPPEVLLQATTVNH
jgi:putative ABC transport system substrate-binding protein